MQDRWENREYVVEKQPSPNLPVYVVYPRDREGHGQTLHRNYLLPINSNMGQDEADGSEERVENITSLTPAPSANSSTQNSPDQPATVRCGVQTTRNHLPWRYRNFGLLTDARPTGIWDAQVDLHVCLHILAWLYNTFKQGAVWNTLSWLQNMLAGHHSLEGPGELPRCNSTSGFLGREWSGSKDIWFSCNSLTNKKPKQNPSGEERCTAAPPPGTKARRQQPTKNGKNR